MPPKKDSLLPPSYLTSGSLSSGSLGSGSLASGSLGSGSLGGTALSLEEEIIRRQMGVDPATGLLSVMPGGKLPPPEELFAGDDAFLAEHGRVTSPRAPTGELIEVSRAPALLQSFDEAGVPEVASRLLGLRYRNIDDAMASGGAITAPEYEAIEHRKEFTDYEAQQERLRTEDRRGTPEGQTRRDVPLEVEGGERLGFFLAKRLYEGGILFGEQQAAEMALDAGAEGRRRNASVRPDQPQYGGMEVKNLEYLIDAPIVDYDRVTKNRNAAVYGSPAQRAEFSENQRQGLGAYQVLWAAQESQGRAMLGGANRGRGKIYDMETGAVDPTYVVPGVGAGGEWDDPDPAKATAQRVIAEQMRTQAPGGQYTTPQPVIDLPGEPSETVAPSVLFSPHVGEDVLDFGARSIMQSQPWIQTLAGHYSKGGEWWQIDPAWIKESIGVPLESRLDLPTQARLINISAAADGDTEKLHGWLQTPETQAFLATGDMLPGLNPELDKLIRHQLTWTDLATDNPLKRSLESTANPYVTHSANPLPYRRVVEAMDQPGDRAELHRLAWMAHGAADMEGMRVINAQINKVTAGIPEETLTAPEWAPKRLQVWWQNANEMTLGILHLTLTGAIGGFHAQAQSVIGGLADGDLQGGVNEMVDRADRAAGVVRYEFIPGFKEWATKDLPSAGLGMALSVLNWAGGLAGDEPEAGMAGAWDPYRDVRVDWEERWKKRPLDVTLDVIAPLFLLAKGTKAATMGMRSMMKPQARTAYGSYGPRIDTLRYAGRTIKVEQPHRPVRGYGGGVEMETPLQAMVDGWANGGHELAQMINPRGKMLPLFRLGDRMTGRRISRELVKHRRKQLKIMGEEHGLNPAEAAKMFDDAEVNGVLADREALSAMAKERGLDNKAMTSLLDDAEAGGVLDDRALMSEMAEERGFDPAEMMSMLDRADDVGVGDYLRNIQEWQTAVSNSLYKTKSAPTRFIKRIFLSPKSVVADDFRILGRVIEKVERGSISDTGRIMNLVDDYTEHMASVHGVSRDASWGVMIRLLDRQGEIAQHIRPMLRFQSSPAMSEMLGKMPRGSQLRDPGGKTAAFDFEGNLGKIKEKLIGGIMDRVPEWIPEESLPAFAAEFDNAGAFIQKSRRRLAEALADQAVTDATIDAFSSNPTHPLKMRATTGGYAEVAVADYLDAYRNFVRPLHQLTFETGLDLYRSGFLGKDAINALGGGYFMRTAKMDAWKNLGRDRWLLEQDILRAKKGVRQARPPTRAGQPTKRAQKATEELVTLEEEMRQLEEIAKMELKDPGALRAFIAETGGGRTPAETARIQRELQQATIPRKRLAKPATLSGDIGDELYSRFYETGRKAVISHVDRTMRLRSYMKARTVLDDMSREAGEMVGKLFSSKPMAHEDLLVMERYGLLAEQTKSPVARAQAIDGLIDKLGALNLDSFVGPDGLTSQGTLLQNMMKVKGWEKAPEILKTPDGAKTVYLPKNLWISEESRMLLKGMQEWNIHPLAAPPGTLGKIVKKSVSVLKFNLVVATGIKTFVRDFVTNIATMGPRAGLTMADTRHYRFSSLAHRELASGKYVSMSEFMRAMKLDDGTVLAEFDMADRRTLTEFAERSAAGDGWWKSLEGLKKVGKKAWEEQIRNERWALDKLKTHPVRMPAETVGKAALGAAKVAFAPALTKKLGPKLGQWRSYTDSVPRTALFSKKLGDHFGIDLLDMMETAKRRHRDVYKAARGAGKPKAEAFGAAANRVSKKGDVTEALYNSRRGLEIRRELAHLPPEEMAGAVMEKIMGEAAGLAEESKAAFVTYDKKSEALRIVTEYGIMPFATYTARAVPILAEWAVKNPLRSVLHSTIFQTMNGVSHAMGSSSEELDRTLGELGFGRLMVPFPGTGQFLTMTRQFGKYLGYINRRIQGLPGWTEEEKAEAMIKQSTIDRLAKMGQVDAPLIANLANYSPMAGVSGMSPEFSFLWTPVKEWHQDREAFSGRPLVNAAHEGSFDYYAQKVLGIASKYFPVYTGVPLYRHGVKEPSDLLRPSSIHAPHSSRTAWEYAFDVQDAGRKVSRGGREALAHLVGMPLEPGHSGLQGLAAAGAQMDAYLQALTTMGDKDAQGSSRISGSLRGLDAGAKVGADQAEAAFAADPNDTNAARMTRSREWAKNVRAMRKRTVDFYHEKVLGEIVAHMDHPEWIEISGARTEWITQNAIRFIDTVREYGEEFTETGTFNVKAFNQEFKRHFGLPEWRIPGLTSADEGITLPAQPYTGTILTDPDDVTAGDAGDIPRRKHDEDESEE